MNSLDTVDWKGKEIETLAYVGISSTTFRETEVTSLKQAQRVVMAKTGDTCLLGQVYQRGFQRCWKGQGLGGCLLVLRESGPWNFRLPQETEGPRQAAVCLNEEFTGTSSLGHCTKSLSLVTPLQTLRGCCPLVMMDFVVTMMMMIGVRHIRFCFKLYGGAGLLFLHERP